MRYVAFLRAINVGGRVVRMDDLRRLFSEAGLRDVQTFIASGNVIFESAARGGAGLERTLADRLAASLGYPVAAFVRSLPELAALADHPLVAGSGSVKGVTTHVAFLHAAPGRAAARTLLSMRSAHDDFLVHDRHVLWTLRGRFSDSAFSGGLLEKTLGMPATIRNSTTVRKIASRYAEA